MARAARSLALARGVLVKRRSADGEREEQVDAHGRRRRRIDHRRRGVDIGRRRRDISRAAMVLAPLLARVLLALDTLAIIALAVIALAVITVVVVGARRRR